MNSHIASRVDELQMFASRHRNSKTGVSAFDDFRQLSALFDSRGNWMNLVMMAAQLLLFAAGVYAAWQFFEAGDAFSALRWGLPSAVLLIMSLMIKLALWPVLQTNRILRALARLEPHLRDSGL